MYSRSIRKGFLTLRFFLYVSFVCLSSSACLTAYLSASTSMYLCLSLPLPVCLCHSLYLSVSLSLCLSLSPLLCLSIYVSLSVSSCLSVCLSVSPPLSDLLFHAFSFTTNVLNKLPSFLPHTTEYKNRKGENIDKVNPASTTSAFFG